MKRLCKNFEGDCWYVLKENKGKRTGIRSARASLLAFTTPKQFLETVWPKMLTADNGFAERVLPFYQKKKTRKTWRPWQTIVKQWKIFQASLWMG